jgi:hypothetical protein
VCVCVCVCQFRCIFFSTPVHRVPLLLYLVCIRTLTVVMVLPYNSTTVSLHPPTLRTPIWYNYTYNVLVCTRNSRTTGTDCAASAWSEKMSVCAATTPAATKDFVEPVVHQPQKPLWQHHGKTPLMMIKFNRCVIRQGVWSCDCRAILPVLVIEGM